MAPPVLLLFSFFIYTLPEPPPLDSGQAAFTTIWYQQCLRNSSSLTDTFIYNLGAALTNFSTMAFQGISYSTARVGVDGEDPVYAVFQCRGDLKVSNCYACEQIAANRLTQACPNSVGARIQLEGCFLRYDNRSFFNLDTNAILALCNVQNTSNITVLTAIDDVMGRVLSLAPAQGGFAYASDNVVIAEAQCIGYINTSECSQCLMEYPYRTFCDSRIGKRLYSVSCFYRFELYNFIETWPSPPPAPMPAAPPLLLPDSPNNSPMPAAPPLLLLPGSSNNSNGLKIKVLLGTGVVSVIIVAAVILLYCHRGRKAKGRKAMFICKSLEEQVDLQSVLSTVTKVFSLDELERATQGFHPNNKIGEGGFGVVYKGTQADGKEVAIKKITRGNQTRKEEILNEVNLITSVQHRNLIKLLGCCVEDSQIILVYEYLPNGSLDSFLFGEAQNKNALDWPTRYNIILGIAKGLAYLHDESQHRIIHRDIKASNILLDNHLKPVIADFGIARLLKADATHTNTHVAGTIGYLPPEYLIHGQLSESVDVFSFGVVCLEIITGKQNRNSTLLNMVWERHEAGSHADIVDERLGDAFDIEEVIRVVHVALLCTQDNPRRRPSMPKLSLWLSGISNFHEIPTKPAFLSSTPFACGWSREISTAGGVLSPTSTMDPR